MHTIAFRVEEEELDSGRQEVVNVYVDGVRLEELARRVEQPFADAEGKPELAGSYVGLARDVRWPSRHFLGEPVERWFYDGDTIVLGCSCGEPGCWPLTAHVEVAQDTVTWQTFRTGHRAWDLSALGPFVFDRGRYEAALRATSR
ncbi:MAG TPA: hypothetical protein VF053_10580 [Streptosporangiales bacterium]